MLHFDYHTKLQDPILSSINNAPLSYVRITVMLVTLLVSNENMRRLSRLQHECIQTKFNYRLLVQTICSGRHTLSCRHRDTLCVIT
jgi:hypothetical protein